MTILVNEVYGVYEEGPLVKLQIGNSVLPMSWDVAIRMGARYRVALRNAREYIGMVRALEQLEQVPQAKLVQTVAREHDEVTEADYRVFAEGPDIILEVWNAQLTSIPEVARNISMWLGNSGRKVRREYFPEFRLQFAVAQLSDGNAIDMAYQSRRDATASYL